MDWSSAGTVGGAPDVRSRIAEIESRLAQLSDPSAVSSTAVRAGGVATSTGGTDFAAQLALAQRATAAPASGAADASGVAAPAGTTARARLGATGQTTDWVLPVDARISSQFGMRRHPVTGVNKLHAGVDLAASTGTPIGAAGAGVVVFAGRKGGYGNTVVVDHGDGTTTLYAHASRLLVEKGDTVRAGQTIARVGSTGLSTGPHLHLEVRRDGEPVNPLSWMREHGVRV